MQSVSSGSDKMGVLDYLDDAIITTDSCLHVLHMNAAAEQLYGVKLETVKGKTVYELFSIDECSLTREEIFSIVNKDCNWSSDLVHILNSGEQIWVKWIIRKLSTLDEPDYIFITKDIREEKKQEKIIKKSKIALSHALRNNNAGWWEWNVKENTVRINKESMEIIGADQDELKMDAEKWFSKFHPDDLPEVLNLFRKEIHEDNVDFRITYRIETRNGEFIKLTNSSMVIQRDEKGQPTKVSCLIENLDQRKGKEENLFLENERFVRILDSLPAIVFVTDYDTHTILFANRHTKELLGNPIGRKCHKVLRGYDEPCKKCLNHQLLDRQGNPLGVLEAEAFYTKLNRWYAVRDQAIFWEGKKIAVLEIAFDITPQKETEQKLQKSESRYRQILETANEGVWILDKNNKTVYANKAMAEMLGVETNHLEGSSILDYISGNWHDTFYNKISALEQSKTGQFDFRFKRKDGYSLWAIISSTPIFDENGDYNGFLLMITDITKRKQAENALLESEERLVEAQKVAHIGYWELDTELRVVWASDELFRIYGMMQISPYVPLDDLQQCIHPDDRKRIEHALVRLINFGEEYDEQFRLIKVNDGKVRKVHSRANMVMDGNNKPDKISGIIQDITDFKDLEERLQQSQKMEAIGRLAGGVAHDFNNLLTSISINVSLAMMDIDNVDPIYETLEEVHRGVDRAADLTRQLLTFSRKQLIVPKVININKLIENIHKMLVRVLGEDIEFVPKLKKRLGRVKTDPGQMEQIIVNLAVNARDAMPDGGKLIIETDDVIIDDSRKYHELGAAPGKYVKISISDTGIGMDKDTQSHIFEPFFTTKPMGQGTGLGLATVYGIVNQHGGFVSVSSEIDKGTMFEIFFPKISDKAEDIALAKVEQHLPTGDETVLFVEDDPIVRMIAVKMLKKLNYNVLEAENGEQALEICDVHDSDIDLLLTDIVMPGINGWQLAERIVKTRREIKVLFSSGYTENVIGNKYITKQRVNFIGKPYTPKVLAQKVRDVLDT